MSDEDSEWYTPEWIFIGLGDFDIDVCSPEQGIDWLPAKKWYSIKDDGLSQNWEGRVWCNPPFSKAKVWMDKFYEHANGVALVPVSKTKWMDRFVNDKRFTIEILPSTLKFHTKRGLQSVRSACCLVKSRSMQDLE